MKPYALLTLLLSAFAAQASAHASEPAVNSGALAQESERVVQQYQRTA